MSKKTLNLKQSRPKLAGSLSELSTPQVPKSGEKEAAREGEREHETETVSAWVASGAGTGAISHEDYELKLRRQAEFPSASVPQMQAEFLNIATTWADDDEMDYDAVPVFSDGIGVTVADSPAKPSVKSADADSGKKGSRLAVEETSHEQPPSSKRTSNPNTPAVNPWSRPAPAHSAAESVRSTHSNPHSHRSSPAASPALKSQTIPTTRDHLAEPGSERVSHTESEHRIEKRTSQDYRGEEAHSFESGRGSRPRSKPPSRGEHYDSQTDRPWMDSRRSHESDTSGPYDRHQQHQSHFHQSHEQHPHAPRYPDRRVSIDPTGLNDPYRKSNYPHHPEARNDPSLWRRDDQHPPSRQQSRKSSTSTASPSVSTEKMADEEPLSWRRRSSVQPSTPPSQPPVLSSKSTAGAMQSSGAAALSDEHPQSVESSANSKPSSSQVHPSQIPNENAWRVKKEEANPSRSKTVPTAILKNQNPTPQPVNTGNNAPSAGKSGKDKQHTSYTPAVRPQDASADVSGANKKSRSKSNDRNENAQTQPDANAAAPLQILKNSDPARPSSDSTISALNCSLKNGTPSSSATRGKAASPSASSTAATAQHAKAQANAAGLSVSDIDAVMLNIRKIMLEQQEKQSHGDHTDEAAPEQTDGEVPETVAVVEAVLEVLPPQTDESSRIESKPKVPMNDAPTPHPSSPKKASAEVVTESAPKSPVKETLPPPSSPQKPALALQIASPTPALQPLLHAPFSAQPHQQPRQNLPLPVGAFVYPLPPQLWSLPDAPAIIHPLVGVGAHLYQTQQTVGLGAGMQAHHPWNHAHALPIFGTSRFLNV
ncbi:hypothetical protein BJ741DRAFT_602295 [Chytriomyces cf. hyalinus JEL632]|nr:hypothetical protein BJ741DRAFT_602295 [Chytriomyces cf. hyalinus JEL632]